MTTPPPLQLFAAPHTPMDANHQVQPGAVAVLAQHLIDSGVRGAFVNGTTGEGMALTVEERARMATAWADAAHDRLDLIVHVGAQSIGDAIALAAHATSVRVSGIAAVAPSFHRPDDAQALVDFLATVAAAAPRTPFWYYHLPGITQVAVRASEVIELAATQIPTFAGVKFTAPDLLEYERCLRIANGRFEIAFGVDELLLAGLAIGARMAVGSTYNYAAPAYLAIADSFVRGDLADARVRMGQVSKMVDLLCQDGVLASGKALMKHHGIDLGPTRPPVRSLTEVQRDRLIADVAALGMFEHGAT